MEEFTSAADQKIEDTAAEYSSINRMPVLWHLCAGHAITFLFQKLVLD